MSSLGTFPFGSAHIEVHRAPSEAPGCSSLWLRRIGDGPEVTIAVHRSSGLAFTHNVSPTDQAAITAAFERFMSTQVKSRGASRGPTGHA